MSKVSYVIPCYKSEGSIGDVVREINNTMKESRYDYEIILVNDGSPDNSFQTIKKLAMEDAHTIAVDLAKNFGQHAALMAGFHYATGDVVICLDDDGQTPANEATKLIGKIEEGYDVVYASYEHKQHSAFRNMGSLLNHKMTEMMLGKPKELMVTSYFAAKRFVINEMLRYELCYPYVIGLVLRSTKRICNVPVAHRQREIGESGYTMKKLIALWVNGFTAFSVKPLRLATYMGLFSAVSGFLYLIYVITKFFVSNAAPIGWSSTMAVMLVMGGMVLVALGLIGEYVGRIYLCINATPQFVVREIVKAGEESCEEKKSV